MADPLSSLNKIIKLALKIKEATDTVRQNKEDCQKIRTRAVRVSSVLSMILHEAPAMVYRPAIRNALEDLEETLQHAHELVTACQDTSTVCLYFTAGKQAKQLHRAQDDIRENIMMVVFAFNAHNTIFWTNMTIPDGSPPPKAQAVGVMMAPHVVVPFKLSSDGTSYEEDVEINNVGTGRESPSAPCLSELMGWSSGSSSAAAQGCSSPPLPCQSPSQPLVVGCPVSFLPPAVSKPPEVCVVHIPVQVPVPDALSQLDPPALQPMNVTTFVDQEVLPLSSSLSTPGDYFIGLPQSFQSPNDLSPACSAPLCPPTLQATIKNEFTRAAQRFTKHILFPSGPSEKNTPGGTHLLDQGLRKFSFSELEVATHHFSAENIIGSGAFATVYKGVLHDGHMVAVKIFQHPYVLSAAHIDEVHLISMIKHKNIIKHIGYGCEVNERATWFEEKVGVEENKEASYFLVEEYMPNGSLEKNINGTQLDWSCRFQLIQGIAHGLHCLHERDIVHFDVKPSNILLDSDMNPKITDFQLSRVLNMKGVCIRSDIDTIAGTLGYMPPEYITDGTVSKKHDVYGFGVTLLQMISSMSIFMRPVSQASIEWAWEARQAGRIAELLDTSVVDERQLKEIEQCLEVGLLCTQLDPADRPDMREVIQMLRGERALRTPVRPGYTREPNTNWFGGWCCLRVRL